MHSVQSKIIFIGGPEDWSSSTSRRPKQACLKVKKAILKRVFDEWWQNQDDGSVFSNMIVTVMTNNIKKIPCKSLKNNYLKKHKTKKTGFKKYNLKSSVLYLKNKEVINSKKNV
jgi:hypothetical protein